MTKRLTSSGIYQIRNVVNGKRYIGQSVRLTSRRYSHFRYLKEGSHHSKHLQRSFNKYGKDAFVFEVLLYCDIDKLTYYEQLLVDNLHPEYNARTDVSSNRGRIQSQEEKDNRAAKLRNHWKSHKKIVSDETRRKMSQSNHARGEENGKAVLTTKDVLEIRTQYKNGTLDTKSVREKFGVTTQCVFNIYKRITWKHVGG